MADDELMLPGDVARLFHVDVKTIARWVRDGKLECVTLPSGHRRYKRQVIEQLLNGERR